MEKCIITQYGKITYELTFKKVKNINLRITPDGVVKVSANRFVPQKMIDDFLCEKAEFVFNALRKWEQTKAVSQSEYFSEDELGRLILEISENIFPYFEARGVTFPTIKFRKMVSRWGSCHPQKGVLTFNTNLKFAPKESIEYVIMHEFTHFLVQNHSSKFYEELEKICPSWKEWRRKWKDIHLR